MPRGLGQQGPNLFPLGVGQQPTISRHRPSPWRGSLPRSTSSCKQLPQIQPLVQGFAMASSLRTSSTKLTSALDLRLKTGRVTTGSRVFELAGNVKPARPTEEPIPVGEDASSLIFLHASAKPANNQPGNRYIYNFPDTADLLG